VAAQSVGVREILVQLDGSPKEFEGRFVLFLQTVAVADHAPGFRGEKRLLERLVTEENQAVLVLQVPQARRVILQPF
jgi:hypothetical protein